MQRALANNQKLFSDLVLNKHQNSVHVKRKMH